MKRKVSNVLIGVGSVLILSALAIFSYNAQEAAAADQWAMELMPKLMMQIESNQGTYDEQKPSEAAEHLPDPYSTVMDTLAVDGNDYIGYLMVPKLGLEMPIMSDWSMEKLRVSPCRYAGSIGGDDLVLMGHNYDRGFGQLPKIEIGNDIYFRDVNGVVTSYRVVAKDILAAASVEEMVSGEYDMTLFTCTYGGQNRLTIRCEKTA